MLCVTARLSILPEKPSAKAPVVINHSCLNVGGICMSSTGSSGQCSVMGGMGWGVGRDIQEGCIYVYVCIYIYVYIYVYVYVYAYIYTYMYSYS